MTIAWDYVEKTACRLLGSIHIALALAVIAGGSERFPAPNYNSLIDLTNGAVWPYGLLWLIGGVSMLFRSPLLRMIGAGVVVFISSLWAALFGIAAYKISTAAYTPVAAYGGYALLNATMFWTMFMRCWRNRRRA